MTNNFDLKNGSQKRAVQLFQSSVQRANVEVMNRKDITIAPNAWQINLASYPWMWNKQEI
jgi:hypothetical protein